MCGVSGFTFQISFDIEDKLTGAKGRLERVTSALPTALAPVNKTKKGSLGNVTIPLKEVIANQRLKAAYPLHNVPCGQLHIEVYIRYFDSYAGHYP